MYGRTTERGILHKCGKSTVYKCTASVDHKSSSI